MSYHLLLVSSFEDNILISGTFCKKCIEKKLSCRILRNWTISEPKAREWHKLGTKAVRLEKCVCKK